MDKENNFVSAVIYMRNAENNIELFLKTILEVFDEHFLCSEIVIVNDSSSDASMDIVRNTYSLFNGNVNVSVLNLSCFHGLEVAMGAGVDLAIGDFVYEFDSVHLDFDKDEIMKVYYKAIEGYDMVSASPNKREQLSSKIFYSVFEHFQDSDYKMHTERFRILSRRLINRVADKNMMVSYRKVEYINSGLKTSNIIYSVINNSEKTNSEVEKYRWKLASDIFVLYTNIGYKFSISMTFFMMTIAFFTIVYSIVAYCISTPVAGWTSTILFLSVTFFGVFLIFSIIIKYLQLIVNLIFRRKHYNFESIEKLAK